MNRKARKVGQKRNLVIFIFHQLCHSVIVLFIRPSLGIMEFLCVCCGQRERRQHTCPAEKKKQSIDLCLYINLHISSHNFLIVLPSENGKLGCDVNHAIYMSAYDNTADYTTLFFMWVLFFFLDKWMHK